MELNYSLSGVCESEVLTGVSPANKAARQNQGEGMQGAFRHTERKVEGEGFPPIQKPRNSPRSEEKPRPAGGLF